MATTQLPAGFISHQSQIEMRWAEEDRRREADRAFRRSRLLARFRRILSAVGFGSRENKRETNAPWAQFELSFGDIAGLACEGAVHGLPALPRALAAAWRSEYFRRDGEDSFEPFMVRSCSGHWLLEGGMRELMRLELLRARGEAGLGARAVDGTSLDGPDTRIGHAGAVDAAPACVCAARAWKITGA